MLLANEVVAQDLTERGVPTIYRVHPAPDPERIETFARWPRRSASTSTPTSAEHPKKLARFLAGVAGHAARDGARLPAAALDAAGDATTPRTSATSGSPPSTTCTSPRRSGAIPTWPCTASCAAWRAASESSSWGAAAAARSCRPRQSSQRERRAMAIEREVVDLYGAYLMRDQVGETFDATISGLSRPRLLRHARQAVRRRAVPRRGAALRSLRARRARRAPARPAQRAQLRARRPRAAAHRGRVDGAAQGAGGAGRHAVGVSALARRRRGRGSAPAEAARRHSARPRRRRKRTERAVQAQASAAGPSRAGVAATSAAESK